MSTSHLQKRTELVSVATNVDANDSGFSEICHASEGEDAVWSSSRSASDDSTPTETTFRIASIQRASTPNKYTQYQYPVPNGIPYSSVHSKPCSGIEDSGNARLDISSDSAQNAPRDPVSVHVQFEDGSDITEESKLPHILRRTVCLPRDINPSTGVSSDPTGNGVSSVGTKNNPGGTCSYSPQRRPVKIEIDISDEAQSVYRHDTAMDEEALNLMKSENDSNFSGQPFKNKPKVTELLIKHNTETVPILDLRRQTLNTLDQFLKVPPSLRSVTLAFPEVQTNSQASSRTTAFGPGRVFTSPIPYVLASRPNSYNVLSSSLANTPSSYSRLPTLCRDPGTTPARSVVSTPQTPPVLPFRSGNLPVTSSLSDISSKSQTPNAWTVCFAHGSKSSPTTISAGTSIKESTPVVPSCILPFDGRDLQEDDQHLAHSNKADQGEEPYLNGHSESLVVPDGQTYGPDGQTYSEYSDEDLPEAKPDVNNNRAGFRSLYSDISGEESPTDNFVTSESSCDETTRASQIYTTRKSRKLKRKSPTPRRSPDKRDPRFKGVTIWLQTEFKNGNSQLHLSAFYSNVKVGVAKPRYSIRRTSGVFGDSQSCSEAEGYSPPTPIRDTCGSVKTCASCRTRRTPLWRDAEDGTPLCNACGIRYKKYRLRCSRCWFIPKKDIKTYPNCPACGSALRYSFHRKTW